MARRAKHHTTGRTRAGTLVPSGTHPDGTPRYRYRLRLADGTKSPRLDVPAGMDRRAVRAFVAKEQAAEDKTHALVDAKQKAATTVSPATTETGAGETWETWFDRYLPTKECGETHRRITGSVVRKWVTPLLGHDRGFIGV